jgi:3-dehydroquinate synthase
MRRQAREAAPMNWRINGPTGDCRIALGRFPQDLAEYCPTGPAVVVADAAVYARYSSLFPRAPLVELPPGEAAKSLDVVRQLYDKFLAFECDRGGVTCDVTGFAAATYLRGMPCGYVPTTLLAQADAAIGGKTGVNFHGYKNLVGAFQQPRFVLCDPALLKTLPAAEVRHGLAEVVKHAAIADADGFRFLESETERILALDDAVLPRLIGDSIRIKTAIVNRDARESGERRLLNFGHTIGHALEKTPGAPHGEAIARGMAATARLSVRLGSLPAADAARLLALLERFGLPTQTALPRKVLLDALAKDKKRLQGTLHFVLLEKIGQAVVRPLRLEELAAAWDDLPQL